MAIYTDIITDSTNDLIIENGDFKLNESDSQHVEHIITADKGQFRQWPLIGVGINRLINGSINPQSLKQVIKLNLESDNYNVRLIEVDSIDKLSINVDAQRKNY
jgi:hypothetical protein